MTGTSAPSTVNRSRRGPENRMNDLSYTEWMKFQKSFFDFTSLSQTVCENLLFFTKEVWPSHELSTSLVISPEEVTIPPLGKRRIYVRKADNIHNILTTLEGSSVLDFILVDLRQQSATMDAWINFLNGSGKDIFEALRLHLREDRYCCVLSGPVRAGDLPTPWIIGLQGRKHLRLRDEKIGTLNGQGVLYALYFQAQSDMRPPLGWARTRVRLASTTFAIPTYLKPKSPPRSKEEIGHPAKFPEGLVSEFVQLFTEEGQAIIDPMVGTGSALIAALRCGRTGVGVDLNPEFVELTRRRINSEYPALPMPELQRARPPQVYQGDARLLSEIGELKSWGRFHYAITSPPYWSVLRNRGSENQRARRQRQLPMTYSQDPRDLGNIDEYEHFLSELVLIFDGVAEVLEDNSILTVVLKNVKRHHVVYPLAWDLTLNLCHENGRYGYLGTTFWCQDDVRLKPFAVGTHWVSNVLHQYCLHFQRKH